MQNRLFYISNQLNIRYMTRDNSNVRIDWTIILCCFILVMMIVMVCRVWIGVNDSINRNKQGYYESIESHTWVKGQ